MVNKAYHNRYFMLSLDRKFFVEAQATPLGRISLVYLRAHNPDMWFGRRIILGTEMFPERVTVGVVYPVQKLTSKARK